MRALNNNKRLDNSSGIGQDNSDEFMNANEQSKKTPWHLRFASGALKLKEMAATAGFATIYGLLFAGLLLMPFQSHRATAADPPSEDNYEAQVIPIVGAILYVVGGIAIGIAGNTIYDGIKWKKKQLQTPNAKIVAITSCVEDSHEGEIAHWYQGNTSHTGPQSLPDHLLRDEEDFAAYRFNIIRIAWNADTERYESTNEEWNYYGNGYFPDYTAGSDPEGIRGDADTGRKGFLITSGWTRNEDIMGAFDSRVTPNRRSRGIEESKLAAEGDPGYDPVAYVDLDDMSYGKHPDGNRGVWTYTPRTTPTKFTQRMSATVSQYKTIDTNPKNTRFVKCNMGDNKSTLKWKKGETKAPPTARHRVENPDGTVIIDYRTDEDVPLYYLYQHQEIDDEN